MKMCRNLSPRLVAAWYRRATGYSLAFSVAVIMFPGVLIIPAAFAYGILPL